MKRYRKYPEEAPWWVYVLFMFAVFALCYFLFMAVAR